MHFSLAVGHVTCLFKGVAAVNVSIAVPRGIMPNISHNRVSILALLRHPVFTNNSI